MKFRHPRVVKALGLAAAWTVRGLIGTMRFRQRCLGPDVRPTIPGQTGQFIYAFWHEYMLLPAYHFARPDIAVLISQHADGQLIAEACRHLGFSLIRGSSTRGGIEALRELMRAARAGQHLAFTPDGPQGPRRQVQGGMIYLAARSGLPIVPFGFGIRRAWRAKSWDRFAIPKPLTFGTCVWGEPIEVPASAAREQQEEHRLKVEQALAHVTELAERWSETGVFPDTVGERLPGAA